MHNFGKCLLAILCLISSVSSADEIRIFVKQFSGKTIQIKVDDEESIVAIARAAYEGRQPEQEAATILNYAKTVNLLFSGSRLDYTRAIKECGIQSGSTIYEVLKSWTQGSGINFDWGTLSAECPITYDDMSDAFLLNPGCGHCFNKVELSQWIQKIKEIAGTPSCPMCRSKIEDCLLELLEK